MSRWEAGWTEQSLARILGLFTEVRRGEATTALLLATNIFLLLAAYYLIKPVRDALILAGQGAEIRSYLSAATAVTLVFVVKAFSLIASRLPRQKLITWVTMFFISNLVVFYLVSLMEIELGTIGIIFFIWAGIFNVMVIAQFWGFANDLYSPEAGKRLFPLVAFGATFGAFSGSSIFRFLIGLIGLYQMLLVAGAVLLVCIGLTWIIHLREVGKDEPDGAAHTQRIPSLEKERPLGKEGGFRLVFQKRYLLYIAFFVLLLNLVNTTGEYILGKYVELSAPEIVDSGLSGGLNVEEYIGAFMAEVMSYFNLLAMIVQLFLVSRIFKWIGIGGAVFVLPFLALGGYSLIVIGASLMIVKWVKIVENGTDYSLMNTARHSLFLVTTREEKYKAKAAIDTFFHRAGDVLQALLVFVGVTFFALEVSHFAVVNCTVIMVWLGLAVLIAREHKSRTRLQTPGQWSPVKAGTT